MSNYEYSKCVAGILICPYLSTFHYIQSSKPIMSSLPEGLPLEIKSALQAIDYKFDANSGTKPIYFAAYSTIKKEGWDCAEGDLKKNLNEVLELLKQDNDIGDRDAKLQKLTECISEIDTRIGFYSIAFYLEHKFKYLRTLARLSKVKRPKSYHQFRYEEIGQLRELEPTKKLRRKITIPEEVTKQSYDQYLIDFESENYNPNMDSYRKFHEKTDPRSLICHSISEVYQWFNNKLTLVYENAKSTKTVDEKASRLLHKLCLDESRGLTDHRFTPYTYMAVPNDFKEGQAQLTVLQGIQFGGTAGAGREHYYELQEGKYTWAGALDQWKS